MFYSLYPDLLTTENEIYSDYFILDAPEGAIVMLVEPRSIMPEVYEYVENNHDKFQLIYTFDSVLLQYENSKLLIYGTVTTEEFDELKTKTISMACSDKDMCEGHRKRRWLANILKGTIDTYGTFDGGEFASNHDIYAQYMFNVAVENCRSKYYFTEKICNCFATKTIPIYYGTPNINRLFNMSGIIYVDNIYNIPAFIDNLRGHEKEYYDDHMEFILDNYERVQKYKNFNQTFHRMYGGDA